MIFKILKRNIVSVLIIFSLLLQVFVIFKYSSISFSSSADGRNHHNGQHPKVVTMGNDWEVTQMDQVAGLHPESILKSRKEFFGYSKVSLPDANLPPLCRQPPNIQECEGKHHYTPVVTPSPVLDPEKMNYTLLPSSPLRAVYGYRPDPNDDEEPLVSILTAFYNIGPIIHETAKCVLSQSLQRFQWIIINDGSPNKTLVHESLDRYREMAQNDSRILVVDLVQNAGLPGARNEGLRFAKGKYVLSLDPDDMIESTYLEKAVWFLETNPQYTLMNAWSVGFGHKEYMWTKGFQHGDINLKENYITVATVMKTKVLKEIGGFDSNLRTGMEDWDLWMRMANNGHWGKTMEEFHFWYRVSPPGKWASIYNETKFNEFHSNQKKKYATAFSQGVPKLKVEPQDKMESVVDVIPFRNKLTKCRRRILLIIPYMEVGGADQFNYNMAQGLALDGWEVSIAANKEAANKWLPEFTRVTPDIFIMPRFIRTTDQTRFLTYLIKSRDFDVVFLSNSEGAYHYLSYLRANAPGPAYVDYTHSETPKWKNGGYARYSAGSEPMLDRSIYASENLRQSCISIGHNHNKTATVLIGIDSEKYIPHPENKAAVRKEFGFPDDVLLIVYVSRLEHEKQPEVFAEVLRRLDAEGHDFRAISIGGGQLFDQLNDTLHQNNLQDKVRLLGTITNNRVSYYVSGSDLFFLPSKIEGISLAIYEAMSQGVMAVSAKVGGQAELVTPDVGYLVKPGTPTEVDEYTAILTELADNREKVLEMGRLSRAKILNGFSVHDTILKLEKEFCYASIASRFTTPLYNNTLISRLANEVSVLGYEYEREIEAGLPVWNELQATIKRCTPPPPPKMESVKRISPYPDHTPDDVLFGMQLTKLRPVYDIFEEKKVDRKLKIVLKDFQEQHVRRNPRFADDKFNHNDFLHPLNHEVDNWDDDIPYPFTQQEYLVYLDNVFIGSGESGTIFDYERVFTLRNRNNQIFTLPSEEYKSCEIHSYKSVIHLLQRYFSFGNFIFDQLPKLHLAWDELNENNYTRVMVPNTPFARATMEQLLRLPSEKIIYYNPGEGWNPCKIYFVEQLLLPTPIPPGHPPKEMIQGLRNIIYRVNDIPQDRVDPDRKFLLYCSRINSANNQRRVENEYDVLDTIKNTLPDYEILFWDGQETLNQTMAHWASISSVIVGMTGSNLAPILAARPNTKVIEFMHENPWLSYWAASESLGLEHWMLPVKGFTHESPTVTIQLDDLSKLLKKSIAEN
ncbi:putative glycosyltransferase [Cavenderia fasciculata]|uniref:Glycosyltransferase n=1 Tax=Cavenderia fasciculata TaxID=261658 RepID=F4PLZ8_CACFS|nr:putative glycosyltransferase [Cavenderia fasciculata]EGG23552.1 putative glycosyltransferase [Cavenderia fasciculata]|eukprot:XP_004361403.1 putative glycosyltransferase [Cavenderia fasciculata]